MKHTFIEEQLSVACVDTSGKEIMTLRRCSGEPDLLVQEDRRGPAPMGNSRFPDDVASLAPVQRQTDNVGLARLQSMTIGLRSPKVRPVSHDDADKKPEQEY